MIGVPLGSRRRKRALPVQKFQHVIPAARIALAREPGL